MSTTKSSIESSIVSDDDYSRCCNDKGTHELHCDSCLKWFHLKCAKMPRAVFKVLGDLGSSSAWFCEGCVADDVRGPKMSLRRLEKTVSDIPIKFTEIINAALKDFKVDIKSKLKSWISEEIEKSFSLCNNRIHELEVMASANKVLVEELQGKLDNYATTGHQAGIPQHLWNSVDKLERQARRGDIVFGGIPDSIPEANLANLVVKSAEFLNLPYTTDDIARCIRLKRKNSVLVTFISIPKRDLLMKNYLMSKNLTLKDVHPTIKIASRIYLNDNITAHAQTLFMTGRELVKNKKISRIYIRRGGVFVIPLGESVGTQVWSLSDFPTT